MCSELKVMPTIAEGGPEYIMLNNTRSWTDDLPLCKVSGIISIKVTYIYIYIIVFYLKCKII